MIGMYYNINLDQDNVLVSNKLSFDRKLELGKGSCGTIVYKGLFEDRKVAVKRIQLCFHLLVDREMHLLPKIDAHPNIIRFLSKI